MSGNRSGSLAGWQEDLLGPGIARRREQNLPFSYKSVKGFWELQTRLWPSDGGVRDTEYPLALYGLPDAPHFFISLGHTESSFTAVGTYHVNTTSVSWHWLLSYIVLIIKLMTFSLKKKKECKIYNLLSYKLVKVNLAITFTLPDCSAHTYWSSLGHITAETSPSMSSIL